MRVFRKIIGIGWKCFFLYKHRSRVYYHHIGNYIDSIDLAIWVKIPLLLCTIVFIAVVHGNKCLCPLEWQWQVGIVAVFLAWADVVLYMRKLRLLGKIIDNTDQGSGSCSHIPWSKNHAVIYHEAKIICVSYLCKIITDASCINLWLYCMNKFLSRHLHYNAWYVIY